MADILTTYYKPKPGGLCKRYFRAITALLQNGHTVHYLSVEPFPIVHTRCHYHRFPWPSKASETPVFWLFFYIVAPFLLLCIGYRKKITHLFSFGTTYAAVLKPLKIVKKLPLSLFLRADVIRNLQLSQAPRWIIMIEKIVESIALSDTYAYGVSKNLINDIAERKLSWPGPPLALETLYNDITPAKINVSSKHISPPLILGCAGILENRKNQEFLIKLMASLSSEQAQLHLYGVGPDAPKLKELIDRLHLGDRVFLEGWVHSAAIFSAIDILLMPSLHEGCPNAVLEAMAHEIPVLASDIPEHREILPSHHLLALDIEEWLTQIATIILNLQTNLNQMVEQQVLYVEKLSFDWDQNICNKITR